LFSGDDAADEVLRDPTVSAELPGQALLAAEKEMLGLYVSDHPLLAVEPVLRATTSARASDVASLREGDTRTLGGLVTRVRRRFTKKGESMATFVLEDLDGAVEGVVFPSAFGQVADLIVEDTIVCVKGRVDLRDDQPKIVALELWRPNLADSGEPLVLSVRADACTPELIDRLKAVLEAHAGPTQVHLRLTGGEGQKLLRLPNYGIERRNGLYADLKALLGPGAFG
jgi:DNA polymerase-3 subunit alpha